MMINLGVCGYCQRGLEKGRVYSSSLSFRKQLENEISRGKDSLSFLNVNWMKRGQKNLRTCVFTRNESYLKFFFLCHTIVNLGEKEKLYHTSPSPSIADLLDCPAGVFDYEWSFFCDHFFKGGQIFWGAGIS